MRIAVHSGKQHVLQPGVKLSNMCLECSEAEAMAKGRSTGHQPQKRCGKGCKGWRLGSSSFSGARRTEYTLNAILSRVCHKRASPKHTATSSHCHLLHSVPEIPRPCIGLREY